MRDLKQSTATVVPVGVFASKDTALALTGLADQSANARLVTGGTGAAFTAASWAHDGAGQYLVGLTAAHTATVGRMRLAFALDSTYLPVWEDFRVLSAAVYDWLHGTAAPSTLTAAGVWAGAPAGTPVEDIAAAVWDEAPPGTPVEDIAGAVWDEPAAGYTTAGTFGDFLDAPVSAIGTGGGGGGATADAVADAVRIELAPELARIDVATSTRLATAGYAAAPTSGTVAAAVWDLSRTGHATAGTFGAQLDAAVSSRSTYAGADTAGTTTLLSRLTAPRATALDSLDAAISTRATPAQVNLQADQALADAGVSPTVMARLDVAVSSVSGGGGPGEGGADTPGTTTLLSRLTAPRAGYLDNLDVGGLVASSDEATAIQVNTRVVRVVPAAIARDGGTYRAELLLYDEAGAMESPDDAPAVALANAAGEDRSGRLSTTTMDLVSPGRYEVYYGSGPADPLEQLIWTFTVVEGGVARVYANTSSVTDAVAADFTAADRTKLDSLEARITETRADNLDSLDAAVSSRSTYAGGPVAAVTGDVGGNLVGNVQGSVAAVATVTDKAGYSLGSTGLDAIPMTLSAAPTNFREWMVWLSCRFRRTSRDKTTGQIRIYGSDGSTVVTTQTSTDTETAQSTGAPS